MAEKLSFAEAAEELFNENTDLRLRLQHAIEDRLLALEDNHRLRDGLTLMIAAASEERKAIEAKRPVHIIEPVELMRAVRNEKGLVDYYVRKGGFK